MLSADCRPLRRALRPLVWVTLEEVALDAVVEDGRVVARTSARQVAERLGIDPGTAAAALRDLRERGLVTSFRETGPAGRFGLSIYQLGAIAGLTVMSPGTADPRVTSPLMAQPGVAEPGRTMPCLVRPPAGTAARAAPGVDRPDHQPLSTAEADLAPSAAVATDCRGAKEAAGSVRRPSRRMAPGTKPAQSLASPGQGTFDFGSVSS